MVDIINRNDYMIAIRKQNNLRQNIHILNLILPTSPFVIAVVTINKKFKLPVSLPVNIVHLQYAQYRILYIHNNIVLNNKK